MNLASRLQNPNHGIHGPATKAWEIGREGVLFLGGGRAALLQLAHPYVAAAIEDHSNVAEDPRSRFRRTFENVWAMSFGDIGQALASARRVHGTHASIHGVLREDVGRFTRGTRYHANDAEAQLWVYLTLVETSIQVFELVVRKLATEEKERFLEESRNFAALFGIPESLMPMGWAGLQEYFQDMLESRTIEVGETALRMAHALLSPPATILAPAAGWYRAVTAALLPEKLRRQFQLPLGRFQQAEWKATVALLKPLVKIAPKWIRYVPAYRQAMRRVEAD